MTNNFLFGFCKNRTLNHKFPTECGRWQNMNLLMYSKSRFLCVFWRIVKARKVDRALHNVFCIVTLSIVIYVDNICIRWETDQKCSPKTLIGSVIVSVLASSAVDRGFPIGSNHVLYTYFAIFHILLEIYDLGFYF